MKTLLTKVSFGLAIVPDVFLLIWPAYSGSRDGQPTHATLLQVNGLSAVFALVFPILATFMPVLFRKQAVRILATILMTGFVLLGAFSIGLLYLPSAAVLLLAACVPVPPQLEVEKAFFR